MGERFIDEPLVTMVASSDTSMMAAGAPGLPSAFLWRGRSSRDKAEAAREF